MKRSTFYSMLIGLILGLILCTAPLLLAAAKVGEPAPAFTATASDGKTYKLADYLGRPRLKTSAGKATVPGRKQVFRGIDTNGHFSQDLVGLMDETPSSVAREFKPAVSKITATLQMVFENGRRSIASPTLDVSRDHFMAEFAMLGAKQRSISSPATYPVRLTAALNAMTISEKLRAEQLQD